MAGCACCNGGNGDASVASGAGMMQAVMAAGLQGTPGRHVNKAQAVGHSSPMPTKAPISLRDSLGMVHCDLDETDAMLAELYSVLDLPPLTLANPGANVSTSDLVETLDGMVCGAGARIREQRSLLYRLRDALVRLR